MKATTAERTGPTSDDPIERAVGQVLGRAHAPMPPGGELRLRGELDELVKALRAAIAGVDIPPVKSASGDALWLLRELRTEVVRSWPEDRPLLPAMRAFEEMQRRVLADGGGSPIEEILTPFARSLLREVAHMIRSPLGSIVMMADTLLEQGDQLTAERRARQHAIIYRAALGLAQVGGELLTLVEQRELEPVEHFSVEKALELVADVARPVTEARGCDLVLSLPDDPHVVGHPETLMRAMLALTLRAALRAREGNVEIQVRREAPTRVTFAVTARGDGTIPDGGVAELLELFRAEPDTGSYTLSAEGLGLAAVAHLIRAMGSELVVDAPSDEELRLWFEITEPEATEKTSARP